MLNLQDLIDEFTLNCANCGNDSSRLLFDDGETVYCSVCCHRTRKDTGEDGLVECPYCHRMGDRNAYLCLWCNHTLEDINKPARKELKIVDEILIDFEDNLTPSNIRYWNIRREK